MVGGVSTSWWRGDRKPQKQPGFFLFSFFFPVLSPQIDICSGFLIQLFLPLHLA